MNLAQMFKISISNSPKKVKRAQMRKMSPGVSQYGAGTCQVIIGEPFAYDSQTLYDGNEENKARFEFSDGIRKSQAFMHKHSWKPVYLIENGKIKREYKPDYDSLKPCE